MASKTTLLVWLMLSVAPSAQPARDAATSEPRHIGVEHSVTTLRLMKVSAGVAAIVLAAGDAEMVRVGDFVGTRKAVVKEIAGNRLTLEETFTGKDGKPNRALIIIKEGERGGTRYLQRSDEPPAIDGKPIPPDTKSPYGSKPAPKKPPQM